MKRSLILELDFSDILTEEFPGAKVVDAVFHSGNVKVKLAGGNLPEVPEAGLIPSREVLLNIVEMHDAAQVGE